MASKESVWNCFQGFKEEKLCGCSERAKVKMVIMIALIFITKNMTFLKCKIVQVHRLVCYGESIYKKTFVNHISLNPKAFHCGRVVLNITYWQEMFFRASYRTGIFSIIGKFSKSHHLNSTYFLLFVKLSMTSELFDLLVQINRSKPSVIP